MTGSFSVESLMNDRPTFKLHCAARDGNIFPWRRQARAFIAIESFAGSTAVNGQTIRKAPFVERHPLGGRRSEGLPVFRVGVGSVLQVQGLREVADFGT